MTNDNIQPDVAKHMGEVNARLTGHDKDLAELKTTTKRIDSTTLETKHEVSHFSQGVAEMVKELRENNKRTDMMETKQQVYESMREADRNLNRWRFVAVFGWLTALTGFLMDLKHGIIEKLFGG